LTAYALRDIFFCEFAMLQTIIIIEWVISLPFKSLKFPLPKDIVMDSLSFCASQKFNFKSGSGSDLIDPDPDPKF
jgi:hypothetical protein